MAVGGQGEGLGRLATGRTVAAALAIHAALVTWIEFSSPSTTGSSALSAVAWSVQEHPGRCAVAVTLCGWGLWKPRPGDIEEPSLPTVDTEAGVDEPIEL